MHSSIFRCLPLLVGALALQQAHAQEMSPAWKAYRDDASKNAPAPPADPAAPASQAVASPAAAPATWPAAQRARGNDGQRGGFFVGVQAGQGWIYEDIDQDAISASAGYRWQAGPLVLVGVEVIGGELRKTEDDWYLYPKVRYGGFGANARVNFGRSPWFAMARLGYFSANAEGSDGDDFDGLYAGLGIGVDAGRHVSFSLAYTGFYYSNTYYGYSDEETEVNRADTVTLGVEARF